METYFDSRKGREIMFRSAVVPNRPPIQWELRVPTPKVKTRREH